MEKKGGRENDRKPKTKSNIDNHSKRQFEIIIQQAMKRRRFTANSNEGFRKNTFAFQHGSEHEETLAIQSVYIFDGSLAWLYGFSKIPVFNINEEDITATQLKRRFRS